MKDNEPIVPECEGCLRAIESVLHNYIVCACYVFPRVQWWFDQKCDRATHIPQKVSEDLIEYL